MLPRQTAAVSAESTALTVMLSMCCMRRVVFRCRGGQKCVCDQCSKTLVMHSPWGQLRADIQSVGKGPFAVLNRRRSIAGCATARLKLLGMLPSLGYQGFRTAPIPSGWVQMGERWALWWNGREVASVTPARQAGFRLHLDALKMWQTKSAPVASVRQGKRFAERRCAARLLPDLPLREAVVRLTDSTPIQPAPPLPGLPPTPEQLQQAHRLDEAAAAAAARVMAALEPIRPPAETKPRATDPRRGRLRLGWSEYPRV